MSGCKKVNKHVTFPVILDLAAFCSSTCVALPHMSLDPTVLYSLYGVVEHSGSLRGGHYVAYVKTRPNGSPYQVNNSMKFISVQCFHDQDRAGIIRPFPFASLPESC